MLSKFASIFLTNIFCNLTIIFKVKKRDTRLSHPWILLDVVYDVYFKVNGSLTHFIFFHSANKLVILFKFKFLPFLAGTPTSKCCSYYTLSSYQCSWQAQLRRWGRLCF